jgi:hypothetical protein
MRGSIRAELGSGLWAGGKKASSLYVDNIGSKLPGSLLGKTQETEFYASQASILLGNNACRS